MRVTTYTATLELKTEKANAHNDRISSVAYSPDGSQILTGSWDTSLKVWEWEAGSRPNSNAAHFCYDSRCSFFALAYAGTLELKTEKANAHNNWITSVAYSPDGLQMVSSDIDGTLKVWEWDSGGHRESDNEIIISYLIEVTLIACHYLHSHVGAQD